MNDKITNIKAVVFDADDTLWSNEPLFRDAEAHFYSTLSAYGTPEHLEEELYRTEMANIAELGYGTKAFIISMVETAIRVSGGKVSADIIGSIVAYGRRILSNPAVPLPGVEAALSAIRESRKFTMALLTKGDLLEQNGKIERSGLSHYFDVTDVVYEKTGTQYSDLCRRLGIVPAEMLMVGNSFKSDIDPVLRLGGKGVYIPVAETWKHEIIDEYQHPGLYRLSSISELPSLLV